MRSGYFTSNGLRLHYLQFGEPRERPIVFLHGGGLSAQSWTRVCSSLEDTYRCYALDLRGHGDSDWSPTLDYGIDDHVSDLEHFTEQTLGGEFVVVGHSLGGHAAIRYAGRHSQRLAGLVLVDTSPFVRDGPHLQRLRQFIVGPVEFDTLDEAVAYTASYQPERDADDLRRSVEQAMTTTRDGRWTWRDDRRQYRDEYFERHLKAVRGLEADAVHIRCPVLVARGSRSPACGVAEASRFVSLLPVGAWDTVRDAGHNVQTENPAGLVEVLRPFLKRVAGDGLFLRSSPPCTSEGRSRH